MTAADRRLQGATFTPAWIVELQLNRLAAKCANPTRIIDAGAGTGRYAIAAARRWPRAGVIAVERDPALAQAARISAAVAGLKNVVVICADYLKLNLPKVRGVTAWVGNPPYVRHHDLSNETKRWYASTTKTLGVPGNQLAGLHVYFFLKSFLLARQGDVGSFIVPAEWFCNGYGTDMRALFCRMGGDVLLRADPMHAIFQDALTTSVITEWTVGTTIDVQFCDLVGRDVQPRFVADRQELLGLQKWPAFGQRMPREQPESVLGNFFKVSRGQVTGCNDAFIATPEMEDLVPERFLFPCITDAAEVIEAGPVLRSNKDLKRVIDLPSDLGELAGRERVKVEQYLKIATRLGAADSYIAQHRTPWWRVRLKQPPPIIMTYMARRAPVFIRNAAGARLLNIAHSLTPLQPMTIAQQSRWIEWLNQNVAMCMGRTYGGGLTKFEPGLAEKIPVPPGGI